MEFIRVSRGMKCNYCGHECNVIYKILCKKTIELAISKAFGIYIYIYETNLSMPEEHIKKLKNMNVVSIKNYLKERGVTVNGHLKPALVTIRAES